MPEGEEINLVPSQTRPYNRRDYVRLGRSGGLAYFCLLFPGRLSNRHLFAAVSCARCDQGLQGTDGDLRHPYRTGAFLRTI